MATGPESGAPGQRGSMTAAREAESEEVVPPLLEEPAADARPRPPVLTGAEWRQRSLDTLQAAREASLEAEALVLVAEATLLHDVARAEEVRPDQTADYEMHIANLRVSLAARKTEAAARCEATVQASINFPAPDEASLRRRLENLTDDVARLNARLESMDDMTNEDRRELQRELDRSTAQLSQTREIHEALTTEFSNEQIAAYMERLRETQRDAQSQGAL
eukprot:1072532-Rhodomonas_salina.1